MSKPRSKSRTPPTPSSPSPHSEPNLAYNFAEFQEIVLKEIRNILKPDEYFKPARFTKDQIRTFLEKPDTNEKNLRQVSQYLLSTSNQYRRLVTYFATMLTLDHVLVPVVIPGEKMSTPNFKRAWDGAVWYMEQYNVKHEFAKILAVVMCEGVYFGYEWKTKDSLMVQRMPTDFCRITGLEDGTWTYAFNFGYFDSDKLKLAVYPPEFTTMYNTYLRDKNQQWQELDPSKAVCFKFDESQIISVPPFSGSFEDAIDLRDFKDMFKAKTKLDNYKLLIQKIPMKKDPKNEKDFVISLPSVKIFHNGIKSAVPDQVGVVSTPMDLTDVDFEKARQKEDTVGLAERNYYGSSGASQLLFNSDQGGSIGLERSIETDQAMMFPFLRQIERFFRKRLFTQVTKNAAYQVKVLFLDLTVYNRAKMLDVYLKAAQFGSPVSLVAATMGFSLGDFESLLTLENDYLKLKDKMTPLMSSHVQTADGEGGRPEKDVNDLGNAGAKTKDTNANKNRAKK
jgi:hypothetical protein